MKSYAVETSATGNKSYFGILTMLDNDKINGQAQELDTGVFSHMPQAANAALLIA
jgi:hypothetical protein